MITEPRSAQEELLYQTAEKYGFTIQSRNDFDSQHDSYEYSNVQSCLVFELKEKARDHQPSKYLRIALVKNTAEIGLVKFGNPNPGKQINVDLTNPESQNMIDAYFDPNNTETI